MTGILRRPRRAALIAITVLVAAASLVSFAESYQGLLLWAHHHGLAGAWAVIWPLQVDVFIAVGELVLFVALAGRWQRLSRVAAWAVHPGRAGGVGRGQRRPRRRARPGQPGHRRRAAARRYLCQRRGGLRLCP